MICIVLAACVSRSAHPPSHGAVRLAGNDLVPIPSADLTIRREWGHTLQTGSFYYQWSEWLEARTDVVIDDIRPLETDAGFEFLETRINFFYAYPEHPIGGCLDHWPPDLAPRLFSPKQVRVMKGDRFAITFFFRTTRAGDFSSNGFLLDYKRAGRSYRQTSHVTTLTAHVQDHPTGIFCDPRQSVDRWVK